jgi:hypothetical protein
VGRSTLDEIRNFPIRADGLKLGHRRGAFRPPAGYGRHLDGDFAIGVTISQESSQHGGSVRRSARIAEMNQDPELDGVNFLTGSARGRDQKTLKTCVHRIFGRFSPLVLYAFLRPSTTLVSAS